MPLPITIPFTFGNATTTQSLSSLDADFSTVYNAVNGIGNGTVSLSNVSITGGIIANAAITGTISYPDGGYQRNRIINGAMQIWQRGTGSTAITSTGVYISDRWLCFASGANGTAVQTSSVPSGQGFQYSLSLGGGVGNTGLQFQQRIESVNCVDLNSTTVTVSFWVLQSSGGNLSTASVSLYRPNSPNDYTSVTQLGSIYTIPVLTTGVWTKVTCSFATDSSTSNGIAVAIVNGVGFSSAQGFVITGVQLEVGAVPTPFERRQYGTELMLCQRYYQIFPIGLDFTAAGAGYVLAAQVAYPVNMRASPTLSAASGAPQTINGTLSFNGATLYGPQPQLTATAIGRSYYYMLYTAASEL